MSKNWPQSLVIFIVKDNLKLITQFYIFALVIKE